jgi:hypothetical protein
VLTVTRSKCVPMSYSGPKGRVVTDDLLNDMVKSVEFHMFQGTNTIACAMVLDSGFVVVGISNPLPTTEFDPKVSAELARKDALDKLAELAAFSVYEVLAPEPPVFNLAKLAVNTLKESVK